MIYAGTIFLSSFLLFLVQPLIARLILPWFGGSAAVWTTCMLFFQALLLGGYFYAHVLVKLANKRVEVLIHSALLVAALATLPIAPSEALKPAGTEEPVSRILVLLGASVGLPYFLLAATSPLLQAWFARARPGENPYRLFAVSNLASLVALVGYPFLVEPVLGGAEQVSVWSWLFAGFAALCAAVAWLTPKKEVEAKPLEEGASAAGHPYLLWLVLAATGSVLLLAVTNHLTQNVASVPLLWLAPLTLYLASFILTFEGGRWYQPRWLWIFVLAWVVGMGWLLVDSDYDFDLPVQLGVFLPGLLLGCLFCHGELYRLRPPPSRLTVFYLTVSAGGALGGFLVAVVAPRAFAGYYELGIGLTVLAMLAALRFAELGSLPRYASLAVLFGIAGCASYEVYQYQKDVTISQRSFYGVLRVKEYGAPGDDNHVKRLLHGAIMHGEQYQTGEPRRRYMTTYYHPSSGVGGAIMSRHDRPAIRVGVIGLGTGTLAAYGRPGDTYRFYEIDRRVIETARSEFTFLADSYARVELVLGDARLRLEREPPQEFDVLVVDAFSSDAIPVHLITLEALRVYLRHVKPDGIVAFHVSNRYLNLVPVVARLADEERLLAAHVSDDPPQDDDSLRSRSDWVLVARSRPALENAELDKRAPLPAEERPEWRMWTDDYSNLVQILKRRE